MIRLMGLGAAIGAVLLMGYLYGESRYTHGRDSAIANCQMGINSLQSAIAKNNSKSVKMSESQKQSYKIALDIRNESLSNIESRLKAKLKQIEVLKRETKDSCVNALIPPGFK